MCQVEILLLLLPPFLVPRLEIFFHLLFRRMTIIPTYPAMLLLPSSVMLLLLLLLLLSPFSPERRSP